MKLADVAEINPRRPAALGRSEDAPTTFVPMEAVDEVTGTIATPQLRPYGEVKKGYTCFAEGDVLFAKITPCMQNGKHAIARRLTDGIGFGSTEFHVLRPCAHVTAEWIHCLLRRPEVLMEAQNHFTGAVGQQRVPPEYVAGLQMPLPPLHDQRRIVAVLNERMAVADKARKAAEAQLDAVNALPAALLRRAFAGEL